MIRLAVVLIASLIAGSSTLDAQRATRPPVVSTAVVNLNTASVAELEKLPGVGATTAARIIEYRQKKGPFKKIEELMNVQGIGEKSFLKLKPQLTVSSKPEQSGSSAQSPQR